MNMWGDPKAVMWLRLCGLAFRLTASLDREHQSSLRLSEMAGREIPFVRACVESHYPVK